MDRKIKEYFNRQYYFYIYLKKYLLNENFIVVIFLI